MFNADRIKELVIQASEIEKGFTDTPFNFYDGKDFRGNVHTASAVITTIDGNQDFRKWRDELLAELEPLSGQLFVDEILEKLRHIRGGSQRKKFADTVSKLNILFEKLDEYVPSCIEQEFIDERILEESLVKNILKSMVNLQKNHTYTKDSSENQMNDFVRDMLSMVYETNDQTRQGESEEGKDAGIIDIQLLKDGLPVVMIEALKMKSKDDANLKVHIDKVLTNYDPNGCPYAIVLIYVTRVGFDDFYSDLIGVLNKHEYPFNRETDILEVETGYAELKHLQTVLKRNDKRVRLHFFINHIVQR